MIFRQGDILLKSISELPKGIKKKNLILAYGEATGHCHQFIDHIVVAVYEVDQQQFVEVLGEMADLIHNEHDTLEIPKGKYEVVRQREVDLTNEIRRVSD